MKYITYFSQYTIKALIKRTLVEVIEVLQISLEHNPTKMSRVKDIKDMNNL